MFPQAGKTSGHVPTDRQNLWTSSYKRAKPMDMFPIQKDGFYKPEEIILMPIPGSGGNEFLFCTKMYYEVEESEKS